MERGREEDGDERRAPAARDDEVVGAAIVAAANELTARWAAAASRDAAGGFALSGVGVWTILALLASAAAGDARAELAGAVGLPASAGADAAVAVLGAVEAMADVHSALGVWGAADVDWTPWWRETVPASLWDHLRGDLAEDQARLDDWVSEHTDGLIERLPIELRDDIRLLIVHALTIDASWRTPFTDAAVQGVGDWEGRWITAMARRTGAFDDVTITNTPSGPITMLRVDAVGDVVVHLAMGDERAAASEVIAGLLEALAGTRACRSGSVLTDGETAPGLTWADSIQPEVVQVVPRFTVTSSHDLLATAELFGLVAIRDDARGHLPGVSASPLAISDARQDITASFTERGFRAAALTVFAARAGAMLTTRDARSLLVTFDRPFAFVATSQATGIHLVVGWITRPDEPAA